VGADAFLAAVAVAEAVAAEATVAVVAAVAVPAPVDVVGPGNGSAQRRRLEWRAAERRQREGVEVAAAEEGLCRAGLRPGGGRGRGELEAGGRRRTFDPGKHR